MTRIIPSQDDSPHLIWLFVTLARHHATVDDFHGCDEREKNHKLFFGFRHAPEEDGDRVMVNETASNSTAMGTRVLKPRLPLRLKPRLVVSGANVGSKLRLR